MAEYYRDTRDFQNIQISPESKIVGRYQTEADRTAWGSSADPSTYSSAQIITVWSPATTFKPQTIFSDTYINDQGNAPPNRITGFPNGNYRVWVYVFGGSGTAVNAHGVTVGSAPEALIQSSTTPNTGVWRQVGAGTYAVDSTTVIQFRFTDVDGYIHAIKAICLKSNAGAPALNPVGNTGDLFASDPDYTLSSANLRRYNLVASTGGGIWVYAGVSTTLIDSFSLATYAGHITVGPDSRLITLDSAGEQVYIYDWTIINGQAVMASSFAIPNLGAPWGIDVNAAGNLVTVNRGTFKAYIHQGISPTITTSFDVTNTYATSLAVALNDDLVVASDPPSSVNQVTVYTGLSGTVRYSFPSPGSASNYASDMCVDVSGNLLSLGSFDSYLFIHSGTSSIIISSFYAASLSDGITLSVSDRVNTGYIKSEATISLIINSEYVSSSCALNAPTTRFSNRVTGYINGSIYIHSGLSNTTTSIWVDSNAGGGITADSSGNLITKKSGVMYVHSGATSTITSSFSAPFSVQRDFDTLGIQAGNLLSSSTFTIYIHSGLTSTVSSSYTAPGTDCVGIAWDFIHSQLLSWEQDTAKVYQHSGTTSTVVSSFTLDATNIGASEGGGLAVDEVSEDLIATKNSEGSGTAHQYIGISGALRSTIGIPTQTMTVNDCAIITGTRTLDFVKSLCSLGHQMQYTSASCTLASPVTSDYVSSSCILPVKAEDFIKSSSTLQASSSNYVSSSCILPVKAEDFIKSSSTLQASSSNYALSSCSLALIDYVKCAALLRDSQYIVASCVLQSPEISHTKSLCQLEVKSSDYAASSASLNIQTGGGLTSCDLTTRKIYTHQNISSVILSSFSFSGSRPNGIDVFQSGNVVACDVDTSIVYIHSGATSSIVSSFVAPYASPSGIALDITENLAICSQSTKLIYVHSGATSVITSSFLAPDTSGGGAIPVGLGATLSGNLISVVTSGHVWGNQSKVSIHSGFSSTVISSFENAWQSASLLLTGADVDDFSNLLSCDVVAQKIRIHDGITAAIAASFASPGTEPAGLGIRATQAVVGYVISAVSLVIDRREFALSSSSVEAVQQQEILSRCHLVVGSIGTDGFIPSSTILQAADSSFLLGSAWLNLPGDVEYVSSAPIVQVASREYTVSSPNVISVLTARDYCRDARDFRGMLGSYALGIGYGYDAMSGGWSGSGGHGADYTSAIHLTAADPAGSNIQNTVFSNGYLNRENLVPLNRVQNFVAGNYYIWVYVNGGTANNAHGVTVGANPEVIVASGNSTWQWKLVGNYFVDATTTVQFRFANPDGHLHAIRTICLKDQPGAPADAPTGGEGDKSSVYSFGMQEVLSATALEIKGSSYIKASAEIQVSALSFILVSSALAVVETVKGKVDLNGESRWELINSITNISLSIADYVSGQCFLNGALQGGYALATVSLHIAEQKYVKSSAALDGESFYGFVKSDPKLLTFVYDSIKCLADLSTALLQDDFSILVKGVFFLGDTYTILSDVAPTLFQDTYSIIESIAFASEFRDDFRVMSQGTQAVLDADVQKIKVGTS